MSLTCGHLTRPVLKFSSSIRKEDDFNFLKWKIKMKILQLKSQLKLKSLEIWQKVFTKSDCDDDSFESMDLKKHFDDFASLIKNLVILDTKNSLEKSWLVLWLLKNLLTHYYDYLKNLVTIYFYDFSTTVIL